MNIQAFDWATVRMEERVQGKTSVMPAKAFEHERAFMPPLPPHLPAPYLVHERDTDQYGYAAFEGNYYWVPGTRREALQVTPELFVRSLERAHKYRIGEVGTIERIALLYFNEAAGGELPWAHIDEAFTQRAAYRDGALTNPPDLSIYDTP